MIGTTSGLRPPQRPHISGPPRRCGKPHRRSDRSAGCSHSPLRRHALSCPLPGTRDPLRPTVATRSVLFRPRAFSTPRRFAPETGSRAYCSPLPAGVHRDSAGARPAGKPAGSAPALSQRVHPEDVLIRLDPCTPRVPGSHPLGSVCRVNGALRLQWRPPLSSGLPWFAWGAPAHRDPERSWCACSSCTCLSSPGLLEPPLVRLLAELPEDLRLQAGSPRLSFPVGLDGDLDA